MRGAQIDRARIHHARARVRLEALISPYVELKKRGRERLGLCPFHGEKTPSFTVNEGKGFYHCFGCGAHGDQIDWLMRYHGLGFVEAARELLRIAGLEDVAPATLKTSRPRQGRPTLDGDLVDRRSQKSVVRILGECERAAGSLVEAYLRGRAIDTELVGDALEALRFHPDLWHSGTRARMPAMVAPVIGPDGRLRGLHRTYLEVVGCEAIKARMPDAKMMLGRCYGGAVALTRAPTSRVFLAEGIETALSVLQLHRESGGDDQVLAALSLGNIAGSGLGQGARRRRDDPRRDPRKRATWRLPSEEPDPKRPGLVTRAREVTICAEKGNKDPCAYLAGLARADRKHRARGQRCTFAWPTHGDFNDDLQARAKAMVT